MSPIQAALERALITLSVLACCACSAPNEKLPGGDVAEDTQRSDDTDVGSIPDGSTVDGYCPVTNYEACGGDLLGTWAFLATCPEDPEAAAALCEHPYDDRAECVGEGNAAVCDSQLSGTLTFNADGSIDIDVASTIVATWTFTDGCLAVINRDPMESAEACIGLASERLACEYSGGHCTCVGEPITQADMNTSTYEVSGDEVTLGEEPPASYCIDGDRLTMDYYLFHPISWRYWILERR